MSLKPKSLAFALLASLVASSAFAQTTGTTTGATNTTAATTTATTVPTPASASNPTAKLTSKFSQWAGSTENATALVEGLRSGKPITLASTAPAGSSTTGSATAPAASGNTTFTPPTKPMGYGNIKIALSLAKTQLAQQGITQPTPEQMQTALMGGKLTTGTGSTAQTSNMQGVLQMRADGMGWGKIANTMGVKLGAVVSGKANVGQTTGGTTTAAGTAPSSKTHGNSAKGVTTAGGAGGSTAVGKGHAKSGIVTAAGGTGGGNVMAGGAGKGGQSTIVSAAGGGNSANAGGNANHGKNGK